MRLVLILRSLMPFYGWWFCSLLWRSWNFRLKHVSYEDDPERCECVCCSLLIDFTNWYYTSCFGIFPVRLGRVENHSFCSTLFGWLRFVMTLKIPPFLGLLENNNKTTKVVRDRPTAVFCRRFSGVAQICGLGLVEHDDFDLFLYFWSSFLNLGYTSLRLA